MRNILYIVVHATGASQNQTVESIKAFWKNVLGWKNVGYHIIIPKDGTEVKLADLDKIVNGVQGKNTNSVHVSWIGGQGGIDNRTDAQKKTLENVIKRWHNQFPKAKILGHRDFSPDLNGDGIISPNEWTKECPCFDVKQFLNEINLN